MRTTK